MAASNFPACFNFLLPQEGGYSDDWRDAGGATNKGITLTALTAWRIRRGMGVPALQDLIDLSTQEAFNIYNVEYWLTVNGPSLPLGVDLMVFDFGVNAGPGRSVEMLQTRVGTTADGVVGTNTLAAIAAVAPSVLVTVLALAQEAYYRQLSSFPTFGNGWLNRLSARKALALNWIHPPS